MTTTIHVTISHHIYFQIFYIHTYRYTGVNTFVFQALDLLVLCTQFYVHLVRAYVCWQAPLEII